MARPGPQSQSPAQKKAKGETRPCRLVDGANVIKADFAPVLETPDPPNWLDPKGAKENNDGAALWNELAPLLTKQKVLTDADLAALGHLCRLHGEILHDYRRDVEVPAAKITQLRLYYCEFGLTPSSRARVPQGKGSDDNPFNKKKNGPPTQKGGKGKKTKT